ncbi:MAG: hypothetical protein PVG19_05440 [Desulfobacterales bacterium]|jgi:hypothetical protein
MNRKSLSAFFITVVVICKPVFAAPTFEISTSSKVAEKGHTFQIFIEMKTNEPINDIVISITEPEGFHIEAINSPGITAEDEEETNLHSIVKINRLGQNSAVTAAFKVWPPNLAGNPKIGNKQSLYSTREPKTFPINIFYKTESDAGEIDGMYTEKISIHSSAFAVWSMIPKSHHDWTIDLQHFNASKDAPKSKNCIRVD